MKRFYLILLLISLTYQGWTQTYSHQSSSAQETARYEIVQSELGARYTFKIDKYTGEVFQLVETESKDLAWQPIMFVDWLRQVDEPQDQINYQVFVSGLGAKFIFLLHVHSGRTWQLTEDSDTGILHWSFFK